MEWKPIETAPRDGTLIDLTWMENGEADSTGASMSAINPASFALFHRARQISKAHSTREAAIMEAYERGLIYTSGSDGEWIDPEHTIKELFEKGD